jgi:hypothetical protein
MSLYAETVPILGTMLSNLEKWIDAAHEHAKKKSFDPNVLLTQRLAPDMFPLYRQIQSACDQAKFSVARPTGKDAPTHEDGEQSWDELRARIKSVREFVAGFQESDFAGAEERVVPLRFLPGKATLGADYARQMSMPNFWFHLTTTYAILRHNGVELGKRDFIGALTLRDL